MAEQPETFTLFGPIRSIEVIASGRGVRIRGYLLGEFGGRSWRKMKGVARVEDENGWIGDAEIHWFEAHGVGRVRWKIKRRFIN